jgi:hypothetical protein
VTKAVNEHGGFGRWAWGVSFQPADVVDVLARSISTATPSEVG